MAISILSELEKTQSITEFAKKYLPAPDRLFSHLVYTSVPLQLSYIIMLFIFGVPFQCKGNE